MNSLLQRIKSGRIMRRGFKSVILSIVVLFELFAIAIVATHAWVETVSSIKIINETDTTGKIDTFVYTDAMITSQTEDWTNTNGFIDLADYFKKSGKMHLAPASSVDGRNFYFPQLTSSGYRKGNSSDMNTTYMSVTFKLRAETNVDFFFFKTDNGNGPSFAGSGNKFDEKDIRVSVTAYSEGNAPTEEDTKIFAILPSGTDTKTDTVVCDSNGDTDEVDLKSFASSVKGSGSANRLFSVGAEETKIITINLWWQSDEEEEPVDSNNDGIDDNLVSEQITITNLGLISSLTPRHVTLVPGSVWRSSNPTYYAWCFNSNNGSDDKLYKLEDNGDGTYSFDYPGNYDDMVFVRAKTNCSVKTGGTLNWKPTDEGGDVWNQTVDTTVPDTPVDPTYFITSISGSSESWYGNDHDKSTGVWENPAVIRLKYVDNQDETWGTISGIYDGYTSNYDNAQEVKEARLITRGTLLSDVYSFTARASVSNVSGQSYSDYAFVGWFTDSAGTQSAASLFTTTSTSGNVTTSVGNTPEKGTITTLYARFKKVRTLTIMKCLSGTISNAEFGTITIGGQTSATTASSFSQTFDMGASVSFSANPASGYKLDTTNGTGIYSAASGGTELTSPVTLDNDATYYARIIPDTFNVTAHATYTSYGGSTYTEGINGGTVTVGSASSGVTSTAGVDFKDTVTLTADPVSGYEFIGWYDDKGNELSTDATYSNYQLNTAGPVDVYARFMAKTDTTIYITPRQNWTDYYIRAYDSDKNNLTSGTHGFKKASYDPDTGYYKVSFSSAQIGSFYAILASNDNYADQVPSSGQAGYSGTIGSNYIFKRGTPGSLTAYSSQRCIWFIDGTEGSWIKADCDSTGNDKTKIEAYYADAGDVTMNRQDSYAWICEFDSLTAGNDIFFNQRNANTNEIKNHWKIAVQATKNQYTATSGAGAGSTNFGGGGWEID